MRDKEPVRVLREELLQPDFIKRLAIERLRQFETESGDYPTGKIILGEQVKRILARRTDNRRLPRRNMRLDIIELLDQRIDLGLHRVVLADRVANHLRLGENVVKTAIARIQKQHRRNLGQLVISGGVAVLVRDDEIRLERRNRLHIRLRARADGCPRLNQFAHRRDDAVGLVVIGNTNRRHAHIRQSIDERKLQRHHALRRFLQSEFAVLVLDGNGSLRGKRKRRQRGEENTSVHKKLQKDK